MTIEAKSDFARGWEDKVGFFRRRENCEVLGPNEARFVKNKIVRVVGPNLVEVITSRKRGEPVYRYYEYEAINRYFGKEGAVRWRDERVRR